MRSIACSTLLVLATAVAGCGDHASSEPLSGVPRIGAGSRYRPPPAGARAARGLPVGGLRCTRDRGTRYGAHLEIFARRLDMVIPAGIGIAPPRRREGAYVKGGRCLYPVRTFEPTGLIEVEQGRPITLGEFFDIWGQPLSSRWLVDFRAGRRESVVAYVNGRRWSKSPRSIPLGRHVAIVLEVGGFFPPTRKYLFPPGL